MNNLPALIIVIEVCTRAYLETPLAVATVCGDGALVYFTPDGYGGVRLNGETRIDEYPLHHMAQIDENGNVPMAEYATMMLDKHSNTCTEPTQHPSGLMPEQWRQG